VRPDCRRCLRAPAERCAPRDIFIAPVAKAHRAAEIMPLSFLKGLFGSSEIKTLAQSLANELSRRYPPAMATGEGRKLSPQAVTNILEGVINKAVVKSTEWQLGVIGKARLGNALRWELKDRGYPDKFIETVTEALVVYMSRRASTAS
jgi:hypothetical protein